MKIRNLALFIVVALLASSCGATKGSTPSNQPGTGGTTDPGTGGGTGGGGTGGYNEPTKVTVNAHTLRDSNPPININSIGQQVNEDTWNSFKYASDSKFYNNYNYTYKAWTTAGVINTLEEFTKDGYHVGSTYGGDLYYERKSGNTFYAYTKTTSGEWLRSETTLDLRAKYVYRIQQEIYTHMFEYTDYEYDSDDGAYYYRDYTFGYAIKFQQGYLTYLFGYVSGFYFEISLSFETTIDIPKSYYMK